ncbi:transcriptional regulator [Acinetobacter defluvii]|uniref:Transcriptional regulator n=1 Tax=Acinetobacter defluvii TaxID=1871111 RepID=A0A2S2FF67_9GAMM|nr:transcriptional regulator [Acinetobacter defluvii]AWL29616.1 transcriptional regulator [Acinetobacter defluvii]
MDKIHEKKAFSERLKSSLDQLQHPISPTYLSKQFNLRYSGSPISTQTAHNWLNGNAIPSQEKLQIISIWLRVSSEWLRYGEGSSTQNFVVNIESIKFNNKFDLLSKKQQQLILDLIDQLIEH